MSNIKEPKDEKPINYEVGYRKPPLHTRFQKGHSGNPSGRPSSSKDFVTMLNRALDKPVVLRKNGRTMTKRQLMAEQMANKAASGDYRTTRLLTVDLAPSLEKREANRPQRGLSAATEERIRRALTEPCDDKTTNPAKNVSPKIGG